MRALLRRVCSAWFGRTPGAVIGAVLFPFSVARIAHLQQTFFSGRTPDWRDRFLLSEIDARYYRLKPGERRLRRQAFWGTATGDAWHEADHLTPERIKGRQPLIDQIVAYAERERFDAVLDIGTGHGKWLCQLHDRIPRATCWVGADLSPTTIAAATARHRDTPLQFVTADALTALDYLQPDAHAIVLMMGTAEYLTQAELESVIAAARRFPKVLFAITDAVHMDLERETTSKPRANLTYSHNFRHLFTTAGYRIVSETRVPLSDDPTFQNVLITAES